MQKSLHICHLYPEMLNLYGDRGNILCLSQRLAWRGIDCQVTSVGRGDSSSFTDFDLIFIGGGQDFEQEALMEDLRGSKAAGLAAAAADGTTFLCICGGYQLMGHYYRTVQGHELEYLGISDFYTEAGQKRMVGNILVSLADEAVAGTQIVGFENHAGRTFLGPGVQPLGQVVMGFGNNGQDGSEGMRDRNIFATYCHGPVLPKNPELTDLILQTALEHKYGSFDLEPLPDVEEQRAKEEAISLTLKHKRRAEERIETKDA